jgi:large-conductance mechanosensitive channel
MSTQNQHLQALYMNKAESRARWSYIGILLPLIGIIVGCMAQSTLRRVEPMTTAEQKEVRRINRIATGGIVVSTILFLIGVFFIFVFINAIKAVNHTVNTTDPTSSAQSSRDEVTSQLAGAKIYKTGDTVAFATQTLKVDSIRKATSIREDNDYSDSTYAKDGTKFLVINITVTNTTSAPFTFDDYALYDNKDRQYNAFDSIGDIDNYMAGRDLEPSIPETGVVVYQVPNDATEFRFGGANADTNKISLVKFSDL